MTKKEKLFRIWRENPKATESNMAAAGKKIGLDPSSSTKYIKEFKKGEIPISNSFNKSINNKGIEGFRNKFDDSVIIPKKIQEGIEKYLRDENGEPDYLHDRDFRELCDVSISKWRRYATEFKHLQVKKDGDIYWGHPEIIDEMRRAVQR